VNWRPLAVALSLAALGAGGEARAADPDPAAEVGARAAERGVAAAPLVAPVRDAERRGLPAQVVADKVLEGLAKGVPPDRVAGVAGGLVERLAQAQAALDAGGLAPPRDRSAALADLASALGAGVDRPALDGLVAAARSRSGGADDAVAAANVVAALARRGVPVPDALPLARALATHPRAAPDVVPAFDAWRADGGRDAHEFLADAERRVADGRDVRAAGRGAGGNRDDADRGGGRDAARDDRSRGGADSNRPHGRRP
jgi:hypothetical protein